VLGPAVAAAAEAAAREPAEGGTALPGLGAPAAPRAAKGIEAPALRGVAYDVVFVPPAAAPGAGVAEARARTARPAVGAGVAETRETLAALLLLLGAPKEAAGGGEGERTGGSKAVARRGCDCGCEACAVGVGRGGEAAREEDAGAARRSGAAAWPAAVLLPLPATVLLPLPAAAVLGAGDAETERLARRGVAAASALPLPLPKPAAAGAAAALPPARGRLARAGLKRSAPFSTRLMA
jgi:hypothetical protein